MRTTQIFAQLTKAFAFLLLPFAAIGQATTVNYQFEVAPDGVYLVERVEKTIEGSARKQVIETPLFLRDTVGVSNYLEALNKQQKDLEAQIQRAIAENDFLRSKIQVISGLADSTFFKPKIVAKQ